MWPENLELFQYWKGVGIGVAVGLAGGWLLWRLPIHLRTRRTRRLRKMVLDLHRIEDGFRGHRGPNPRELRVVRVPLRDRIMESRQVRKAAWRAATAARTPEQVAEEAYRRGLVEAAT